MANNHSITEFINKFNGGTRLNRFKITGTVGPRTGGTQVKLDDQQGSFHIRAAALPSSQVGAIPINYRGRTVFYPGDRTYLPWNITILDENYNGTKTGTGLYQAFHKWHDQINSHTSNTTIDSSKNNPANHFAVDRWSIQQLDVNGDRTLRSFGLWNVWPIAIGPIEMDMTKDNVIAEFAVTLIYSHFEHFPTGAPTGNSTTQTGPR
jgi:hypothetical protein